MVRVNERMLEWADIVFVMDADQVEALRRMFPAHPALERVICLDIEDCYAFLEPQLVDYSNRRFLSISDRCLSTRRTPGTPGTAVTVLQPHCAVAAHSRSPTPS